jgi:hypothetical protein
VVDKKWRPGGVLYFLLARMYYKTVATFKGKVATVL